MEVLRKLCLFLMNKFEKEKRIQVINDITQIGKLCSVINDNEFDHDTIMVFRFGY